VIRMSDEETELRRVLAEFPATDKAEAVPSRRARRAKDKAAPAAPATPAPVREYTMHDAMSGWEEGRIGYEQQQAAKVAAAAKAAEAAAEVPVALDGRGKPVGAWSGPQDGPCPWLVKPEVNTRLGRDPSGKTVPAKALAQEKSVPASEPVLGSGYDYGTETGWRDFVNSDGSIRARPRRSSWDY